MAKCQECDVEDGGIHRSFCQTGAEVDELLATQVTRKRFKLLREQYCIGEGSEYAQDCTNAQKAFDSGDMVACNKALDLMNLD